MLRLLSIAFMALSLICPFTSIIPTALAEPYNDLWSKDSSKEHDPPSSENRIVKWCSDEGQHVRYASANITLSGYHPCGTLGIHKTCDPSGNRFFGKADDSRPYAHQDCAVGPRIVIVNHGKKDIIDTSAVPKEGEEIGSLTDDEQQALKEEMDKAAKVHSQHDPVVEMQKLIGLLQAGLFPTRPGNDKQQQQIIDAQKELQKILKSFDPQTKKVLESFLNINQPKDARKR